MQNNKNILLATILSALFLIGWTWFYEKPRMEKQEAQKLLAQKVLVEQKSEIVTNSVDKNLEPEQKSLEMASINKDRNEILAQTKNNRVKILSDNLHGSISLIGARFDDLTLANYFTDASKAKEVVLFSPSQSQERYFADFGWISSDAALQLPSPETIWKANSDKLTPENPLTLSWKNSQNIEFLITISLDENYMFGVKQKVINNSKKDITIASYGRINRALAAIQKSTYILHEGPIGAFSGILSEFNYEEIVEQKQQEFSGDNGGWFGITDKYWLSSILPDQKLKYSASFSHEISNKINLFNSEFVAQEFKVGAAEKLEFDHHLFAGAKKVALLDQYAKEYNAQYFDRAIDFGWFYYITKPFFSVISYLSKLLGNFGLAILAMTVIVKLALFPMANKSYGAIARVKKLQPKIDEIRQRFKDDKMALNREVMDLYKREKVNPASGCLPILIQIPIFFSLYKVFYVTLDMRHAPFYGWIKDLSAPDPTSLFNLFGLLPYEVSPAFVIGIWPILMGITMILQQKLSPMSGDPVQAKVMKWMPYGLTFVLAAFPAGLVIYWTWSNVLSILQQWFITKKLNRENN